MISRVGSVHDFLIAFVIENGKEGPRFTEAMRIIKDYNTICDHNLT